VTLIQHHVTISQPATDLCTHLKQQQQ